METTRKFDFGNDAVARSYDTNLVPILFRPWAQRLVDENQPWKGKYVLDLASGTGVVAELLVQHVIPEGKVTALDINSQMLSLAERRCLQWSENMEFIVGAADALQVPDDSMDMIVCQQGYQFFPDKGAAAREMYRVLKTNGKVIVSTWCSVNDCQFFGVICDALERMGEHDISLMMRIPFDFLTPEELSGPFRAAGFQEVQVSRQELNMHIDGGIDRAIEIVYATPIGPKLMAMSDDRQQTFKTLFTEKLRTMSPDTADLGKMVTNMLTAVK